MPSDAKIDVRWDAKGVKFLVGRRAFRFYERARLYRDRCNHALKLERQKPRKS